MSLPTIDPRSLESRLAAGSAVLVDIREPDEHAREHITGARLLPLSRLEHSDLAALADQIVVFHCKSGNRTAANAGRLRVIRCREAYQLANGIEGWKAAGLPTEFNRSAPIDLQRQVQIGAGMLILISIALALALSPLFLGLAVFVGGGLTVAGVTGFCGLARVLKLMPWNRHVFGAIAA